MKLYVNPFGFPNSYIGEILSEKEMFCWNENLGMNHIEGITQRMHFLKVILLR